MSGGEWYGLENEKKRHSQKALDEALAQAVAQRDAPSARRVLEQGANPSAPGVSGAPLLLQTLGQMSGSGGRPVDKAQEMFDLLLSFGADPNQANENGLSGLHSASFFGLPEAAKSLLARGARVDSAGADGNNAARFAGADAGADSPAREATLALIWALGEAGANFRVVNAQGNTAIQSARMRGQESVALEMEAFETRREGRLIADGLPFKSGDRKPSL